ncbi:MAG: DUF4266 domain-containing protein [Pseudohongiellaceae bacterium]|jgi:hypothetical protein
MRLLLTLCLCALAACQQVEPWQRDILARPHMATEPLPLQSLRDRHLRDSREAGRGTGGAGGGGCGCY